MSASANWANTATATHWPRIGRDDWSGAVVFGPPVRFECGYRFKANKAIDSRGVEFLTGLTVWTEYAAVKDGDRIAIGAFTEADPLAVKAREVRAVTRDQDVFGAEADDYTIEAA